MKILISILASTLLVAGCARSAHDAVTVTVGDSSHESSLAGGADSKDLLQFLQGRRKEKGDIAVSITPSRETPHHAVRAAMDICTAAGFWQIILTDADGHPYTFAQFDKLDSNFNRVLIPTNYAFVEISAQGCVPGRSGVTDKRTPVLIHCKADALHGTLDDLLEQMDTLGNTNVHFVSTASTD